MHNFLPPTLLGLMLGSSLHAADLAVTTTEDTLAGPGCSLRAALRASDVDAPVGGCPAGEAGLDAVLVPSGVFSLAPPGPADDSDDTGDLDVTGPVDIVGAGRDDTVFAAASGATDRVLEVLETGTVSLSGVTVREGQAELGGGIHVGRGGQLTLTDCRVVANESAAGGGVHLDRATATIENCEFVDNQANAGGGIFQVSSTVTVRDSFLEDNRARSSGGAPMGGGGAIAGVGGSIFIHTSGLVDNRADDTRWGGGAVLVISGELTVSQSTLAGNSATDAGSDGSVADPTRDEAGGGALAAFDATVRVENSTVSGNRADDSRWGGGGILSIGSDVAATHSTFWDNSAEASGVDLPGMVAGGTLSELVPRGAGFTFSTRIESSILAGGRPAECFHGSIGPPGAHGSSAIDDDSCAALTSSIGPVVGIDPILTFQGGLTPVHLLFAGSNAIDAGRPSCIAAGGDTLPVDQRGVARPQGSACDLGAVEVAPVVTLSPEVLPDGHFGVSYSAMLSASGLGTSAPYSFVVSDGTLPPGLILDANGAITGTPLAAGGPIEFTVTAMDSSPPSVGGPFVGARHYSLGIARADQETLMAIAAPQEIPFAGSSSLSTIGGSGNGAIRFAVSAGGGHCDVSDSTLTGTGIGTCTVTATKAADVNYNEATATVDVSILPTTDLQISKTDGSLFSTPGNVVKYEILVSNSGPFAVLGARVQDPVPVGLMDPQWTCNPVQVAACPATSGSGGIDEQVDLPVNGILRYAFRATVSAGLGETITNVATITAPESTIEINSADNSASDVNTVTIEGLFANGFEG